MIQLVKTDRKLDFTGVSPAFVVGATLFFGAILAGYFVNQHFGKDFTPCLFKIVTTKPCFICGGTRASLSLATGHPLAALQLNPLITLILSVTGLALFLKVVFARKISLSGPFKDRRFLWMLAITLVLANWIYVIRTL